MGSLQWASAGLQDHSHFTALSFSCIVLVSATGCNCSRGRQRTGKRSKESRKFGHVIVVHPCYAIARPFPCPFSWFTALRWRGVFPPHPKEAAPGFGAA